MSVAYIIHCCNVGDMWLIVNDKFSAIWCSEYKIINLYITYNMICQIISKSQKEKDGGYVKYVKLTPPIQL